MLRNKFKRRTSKSERGDRKEGQDISSAEKRISKLLQREKSLGKVDVESEVKVLKDRIEIQTKTIKGLEQMMKTYETQGDPKSATSVMEQIEELSDEIDRLNALKERLSSLLATPSTETPNATSSRYSKKVRVLFNFDGTDETQLTIRVGDVVCLYDDEHEDWWEGELDGKVGYFPRSYVEPIESNASAGSPGSKYITRKKVRALYDFEGKGKAELPIRVDDIITLVSIPTESSEWLEGEVNGKVGFFPRLYVEFLTDEPAESSTGKDKIPKSNSLDATPLPKEAKEVPKKPLPGTPKQTEETPKPQDELSAPLPLPPRTQIPERKISVPPPVADSSRRKVTSSLPLSKASFQGKARALFQYDGTGESELALQPGDIVSVISTESDEWWEGECEGRVGFFPKSYVEILKDLTEPTRVRVNHDHTAGSESELTIKKGDVIKLLSTEDDEWWEGQLKGEIGFFPKEFTVVIEDGNGKRQVEDEKESEKEKEEQEKEREERRKDEQEKKANEEQQEKERREKEEQEKKAKEEQDKKEKEEKEKKEREEQQEKERKAKEEQEKKKKEEQEKKAKEEQEKERREKEEQERKAKEEQDKKEKEEKKERKEKDEKKREKETKKEKEVLVKRGTSLRIGEPRNRRPLPFAMTGSSPRARSVQSSATSDSLEELKNAVTRLEASVTTPSPNLSSELETMAKQIEESVRKSLEQLQSNTQSSNQSELLPQVEELKLKLRDTETKCEALMNQADIERYRAVRFEAEIRALKKKVLPSDDAVQLETLDLSLKTLEARLKTIQNNLPQSKLIESFEVSTKLSRAIQLLYLDRDSAEHLLRDLAQKTKHDHLQVNEMEKRLQQFDLELQKTETAAIEIGVPKYVEPEDFWKSFEEM